MSRKFAYASAFVGTIALVAVACGGSSTTTTTIRDFAVTTSGNNDGGGDASATSFTASTINAIDTDTIGGTLGQNAAVKLTGLVVVSPVSAFSATYNKITKGGCRFEVWAVDPSCTTPPCGIVLETEAIANPADAGAFCDYSADTTTALNGINTGDKVDVEGYVDLYSQSGSATDGGATATVVQHGIDIKTLTMTDKDQTIPTTMVTDAPNLFTPYTGTGWAKYEGQHITLVPASPNTTLTVTLDSYGGWNTADGSHFADTYSGLYRPDGAAVNTWPPTGSTFTSMSGTVSVVFGGAILPSEGSDLVGFMAP